LMVALGMVFIGLTAVALFYWLRGKLFEQRWLLWAFVFAVVGPFIANQVGWAAAEIGRQPWIVYGLLRTSDAYSKVVPASHIVASLIMFGLIYALLFGIFLYVLNDKIQHGIEDTTLPSITTGEALMASAAALADRGHGSMTSMRDPNGNGGDGGDSGASPSATINDPNKPTG